MEFGLQYNIHVTKNEIRESGLKILGAEYRELPFAGAAPVIRIGCFELEEALLEGALDDLHFSGVKYLVIETIGLKEGFEAERLKRILCRHAPVFAQKEIGVCIENGYVTDRDRVYRGVLSDGGALAGFVDTLNKDSGTDIFRAAFNVGCAELLLLRVMDHARALGNRTKVIYISENDGRDDLRQFPCTFTFLRGAPQVNWFGFLGFFMRENPDVICIGDIRGTFAACPKELGRTYLELFAAMASEWEYHSKTPERLADRSKKLILFGAGEMLFYYMKEWGKLYPPVFAVDNNSALWGKKVHGVKVEPPEKILEIPGDERNVMICNLQYLAEIKKQLEEMGVNAERYRRDYFDR